MKTRCKMKCTVANKLSDSYEYHFEAVIDESEENKAFFKFTPAGQLHLGCTNKHDFSEGKEYYINIKEVKN